MTKIAIIGCGNLGLSLVEGFIKSGEAFQLTATRRNTEALEWLEQKSVQVTSDNIKAVKENKILFFTLKPYRILKVIAELSPYFTDEHIIVSTATGVTLNELKQHAGQTTNVFRAMPNVAASVGQSATCLSKNGADALKLEQVKKVFNAIGETVVINEELMESATVLGACGTAFALRFIRAMVQAGVQIGFDSKTATQIANQTVKGAAELLLSSGKHPEALIDTVTTPKGITITGLNEMEHQGFSAALIRGMITAYKKIEESK
ncbi:MAG: pyrroline-5-carboxylate reductase [Bacteroidetes bacterium HGW-Bacteroidetes-4]|jgi:pyrroline-5-carboxylate reductase|nr:MAG: pyrroline-5-carboxylate reductase [Bacteroidetes bacterium HGW-Bacteroidetes-4]